MSDVFEQLNGHFEQEQVEVGAVLSDKRFSDVHKAELANQIRDEHRSAARDLAEKEFEHANKRVENAQRALVAERQDFEAGLDHSRLLTAQQAATGLAAARQLGTVESAVADAVAMGDVYRLRAFVEVAAPALRDHSANTEAGPAREWGGRIETLERRAAEALADLEPEPLRAAREALQEAQQHQREVASAIRRANERWTRNGGRGPLQPAQEVEVNVNDKTGNMVFSGGRWV